MMTLRYYPKTRAEAVAFDAADPLAAARGSFQLPDGVTYLVGHSLGPVTDGAVASVTKTGRDWAGDIVGAWNSAGWIDLAAKVGERIGRIIGAKAGEVMVCDSVSVNLFKLAAAALPHAGARRIIIETDEFPTDQYIAAGLAELAGVTLDKIAAGTALEAMAGGGVLIKSAVNYRTSEVIDIAAFEAAAQAAGVWIIWDLSHAAGVIDLDLSAARLAVGCTYKYMNGGPGAPAFVYACNDVVEQLRSPLPGWLGHARPFAFETEYEPAEGSARFTAGTPSILSLAALNGALDVFAGTEMASLETKAGALGDMCLARAAQMGLLAPCPGIGERRGGHISVQHEEGYAIVQALAAQGIKADFRTPDTIRFGLSPLFLSYAEVWDAMDRLADILSHASWDQPQFKIRAKVT